MKGAGVARVFFMVAASCDPAWASQTEIGNKSDTLEEAVFQSQDQIFNSPALPVGTAVAYAAVGGVRVRFNGLISALPVGTDKRISVYAYSRAEFQWPDIGLARWYAQ